MKTAENRSGDDTVALPNPMAARHRRGVRAIGNARPQARVWAPAIVMRDPFSEGAAEVTLVEQNHPVQALAPNRPDQPFAKCLRLWQSYGRPQHRQPHRRDGPIDTFRVDAVVIMYEESIRLVARGHHSELLRRPVGGWMFGHIPVPDSSSADLQHHEDVDHTERGRERHEEIAGQHTLA